MVRAAAAAWGILGAAAVAAAAAAEGVIAGGSGGVGVRARGGGCAPPWATVGLEGLWRPKKALRPPCEDPLAAAGVPVLEAGALDGLEAPAAEAAAVLGAVEEARGPVAAAERGRAPPSCFLTPPRRP